MAGGCVKGNADTVDRRCYCPTSPKVLYGPVECVVDIGGMARMDKCGAGGAEITCPKVVVVSKAGSVKIFIPKLVYNLFADLLSIAVKPFNPNKVAAINL